MSTDAMLSQLVVDGESLKRVESPATVDELRNILSADQASLLIAGSGSRLGFGNRGGPFDFGVSTRGMNAVLHYEPDDLTVAVESGITIAELNRVLGERNQMLPFDDASPETSTVGGSFALGTGGPRRLGYGSLKDWVLGVEVMGPDGAVTKSGGMVVKNVTGYDLPRLHYGAHGAFGLVTRLNFKVMPRPEATRGIIATYESADGAHRAGQAILASQLAPASILVSSDPAWTLSICCEGAAASIERQVEDMARIVSDVANPVSIEVGDSADPAIAPFKTVTKPSAGRATARLSIPPSGQVEVLERCQSMTDTFICADLGSGLVYMSGPPLLEWRESIRACSRRAVFLALPPDLKTDIDVFGGLDAPNAGIVTRLKDAFDPARRFNRGRFVLGL